MKHVNNLSKLHIPSTLKLTVSLLNMYDILKVYMQLFTKDGCSVGESCFYPGWVSSR